MIANLSNWWRRRSRWERVVWSLVVLCLLGAVTVKPLVRWVSPQLAVDSAALGAAMDESGPLGAPGGHVADPWGRPWQLARDGLRSPGPDGLPGGGDDIVTPGGAEAISARLVLYSGRLALLLALASLWSLWFPPIRAKRSKRFGLEFVRSLTISSLPAVCAIGAAYLLTKRVPVFLALQLPSGPDLGGQLGWTVVPMPFAVAGGIALLCFLFTLWWRLTRPLEGDEPEEAPSG